MLATIITAALALAVGQDVKNSAVGANERELAKALAILPSPVATGPKEPQPSARLQSPPHANETISERSQANEGLCSAGDPCHVSVPNPGATASPRADITALYTNDISSLPIMKGSEEIPQRPYSIPGWIAGASALLLTFLWFARRRWRR